MVIKEIAKKNGVSDTTARRKMKGVKPVGTKKVKRFDGGFSLANDYAAKDVLDRFAKPKKAKK
jgi:hypothetical protein